MTVVGTGWVRRSLVLYRVFFFCAVAIHFAPSLIFLDDHYGASSARTAEWNQWLFWHFPAVPHRVLRLMACFTLAANGAAIVGYRVRLASFVAGLGFYTFASFNGIHLQTLALITVWANLTVWAAAGDIGPALRFQGAAEVGDPTLLRALLMTNLLIALFFSGIEKVLAGWPMSHELCVLFSYPAGSFVRTWVTNTTIFHSEFVCGGLGYATLLVEIGCPILLAFERLTLLALVAYEIFFLFVLLTLSIPPVFYVTFAAGGLLFLRPDPQSRRAKASDGSDRFSGDRPNQPVHGE